MKFKIIIMMLMFVLVSTSLIACNEVFETNAISFDSPALVVNGEEISVGELRTIYATYVPDQPVAKEVLLNSVINEVVNYRLILQDSRKKGYSATTDEIDEALNKFLIQQRITLDEFVNSLEGTGTTIDDYKLRLSEDILVNKVLAELDISTSETEAAAYYAKNIERYMVPESVIVRQITLSIDLDREELTEMTSLIMEGVREDSFCEVATKYSLDKTCNSYTISKGDAFPAFETAAFSQDIGDITLVQGEDGYFFIETLNKINFTPVPLSDVESEIKTGIGAAKFNLASTDYVEGLRLDAIIVDNIQ